MPAWGNFLQDDYSLTHELRFISPTMTALKLRSKPGFGINLALTLMLCLWAVSTHANKLIVLGDSISAGYGIDVDQGWVGLLAQRLVAQEVDTEVVNASISGNTTGDGLARLPQLLATHQPSVVVVELGGNDGLRGYPLKRMRQNLTRIIELSQNAGARVLLLGIEIPPNYGQRYTLEFRRSFQTVAEQQAVAFVPFILNGIALDPSLMQKDGIHPTQAAQPKLLENIWPEIKSLLSK